MSEVGDQHLIVLLLRPQPDLALALGVDQQGIVQGLGHDGRVLQGQFVTGQSLQYNISVLGFFMCCRFTDPLFEISTYISIL